MSKDVVAQVHSPVCEIHRLIDQFKASLDPLHGSKVVVFNGLDVGMGVDQGIIGLLVPQELLDRGNRAAGVEQLRGGGVAEVVRGDLHPGALPGIADTTVYQVFTQRLVTVQEHVIARHPNVY